MGLAFSLRGMPLVACLLLVGYAVLGHSPAMAASHAPLAQVLDVSVAPVAVSPGDPVNVEATVQNPLGRDAEFQVVLLVDEATAEERSVLLPAGATRILRFKVVRSEPGAHAARVGPHAATFQVLAAQFLVRDLVIDPPVAAPGETIGVRATVENVGAAPGMFQIPLAVNNVVVEARSDILAVGRSKVVAFEILAQSSGTYALAVADLSGSLTVVAPIFQISTPSSVRISLPTTTARSKSGAKLPITQDVVGIGNASGTIEVTLPVALPASDTLATFEDSVSGITYDGATMLVPLRDAGYKEVARLVLTPGAIVGQGTTARLTVKKVVLVVAEAPLEFPRSTPLEKPASFGMEVPLATLKPGLPLRLVPGLRPRPTILAAVEMEARAKGKTLVRVLAAAAAETSFEALGERGSVVTVAYGVPSSWLASVEVAALAVAVVGPSGAVELSPVTEVVQRDGTVLLKAKVSSGGGMFSLVVLVDGVPPKVSKLLLSAPVGIAGVSVAVQAIVDEGEGKAKVSNAILRVNDQLVATRPVLTGEDGSRFSLFHLTLRDPGEYRLSVEGQQALLEVGLRDVLDVVKVTRLSVTPMEAAPGQTVELGAALTSTGSRRVVSEAILWVNGVPVEQKLLAIPPGGVVEASFSLARQREGEYKVTLLNAGARFTVVRAPTPASFQVTDLAIEPSLAEPGQRVSVSFALHNTGELEGTYMARLLLDGKEEDRREIRLEGLTTLPVVFSLPPQGEGIFTVEVGEVRRDFRVLSRSRLSDVALVRLSVEPPTVAGGEPVVVSVEIRNRSATPASASLRAVVGGEIVDQRVVTLEGNAQGVESFSLSKDSPGLYKVEIRLVIPAGPEIDMLEGQFLVTTRRLIPSWEISRLEVVPQPARPLEPLTVSFLLSNLGQEEGELTVSVTVDGVEEVEQVLRLGPLATRQISLPLQGRPQGKYRLEVQGEQLLFTVEAAPGEVPVPGEATGGAPATRSNSAVIIVAVGLVALALATAVYWFLRRRRARV